MKVEAIKKAMLAEHTTLRNQLEVVSDLAKRVALEDGFYEKDLREAAEELASLLVSHMESEERHLAALSRGGNSHWAHHLNAFKQQHVHQRTLLAHFLERVNTIHALRRLGEFVETMVTAVQLDMEQEELALFAQESAGVTSVHGA
jgi:iron-sulfur cluster repair protein YtfE (RIC family)